MSFPYEARIAEAFFGFFEKDFVYKGLKPVYWCWHDHTALAEAEVEYEQHTSPSVYVRYELTSVPSKSTRASPDATSTPSSGPPHRGPCPRRWPSHSIRRLSMWPLTTASTSTSSRVNLLGHARSLQRER